MTDTDVEQAAQKLSRQLAYSKIFDGMSPEERLSFARTALLHDPSDALERADRALCDSGMIEIRMSNTALPSAGIIGSGLIAPAMLLYALFDYESLWLTAMAWAGIAVWVWLIAICIAEISQHYFARFRGHRNTVREWKPAPTPANDNTRRDVFEENDQ